MGTTIAERYVSDPQATWEGTNKIPLDDSGTGKVGLVSTLGEYVFSVVIVTLTQAEYDALSPPDPTKFYVIVDP